MGRTSAHQFGEFQQTTITQPCLVFGLCLALCLLAHGFSLGGFFQADDIVWLQHSSWHEMAASLTGRWELGVAYRPFTRLSYALDAHLFHRRAWAWHAVNLLLHALNGTLLASCLRKSGFSPINAILAALLFVSFPMSWENADWISGRTGLLAMAFGLMAYRLWLGIALGEWRLVPTVIAMCVLQIFALASYEPAAMLPVLILGSCSAPGWISSDRLRASVLSGLILLGVALSFWLLRWFLISSFGVSTDSASRAFIPGLLHNLAAILSHAWHELTPVCSLVIAGAMLAGVYNRTTRSKVVMLLLAAALLYIPFAGVAGFADRFAYLSSAATLLAALASLRCIRPTFVGYGITLSLVAMFTLSSIQRARSTWESGDIVRTMLASVHEQAWRPGNLVFDGVPDYHDGTYLLMGAFEDGASSEAPRDAIVARSDLIMASPPLLRRVLSGPSTFFVYSRSSGRFDEIPEQAWRARHRL